MVQYQNIIVHIKCTCLQNRYVVKMHASNRNDYCSQCPTNVVKNKVSQILTNKQGSLDYSTAAYTAKTCSSKSLSPKSVVQNSSIFVVYDEEFEQLVPSQCWELPSNLSYETHKISNYPLFSCRCICPIHWSQVVSGELRWSEWSTILLPIKVQLMLNIWR